MDTTDCGAACLATVAKHYGYTASLANIRNLAGTDTHGTNIYGMVKAAEKLGFSAKAVKGDQKALLTGFPCPAIAHVVIEGNLFHYVVIHKKALLDERMLICSTLRASLRPHCLKFMVED